MRIVVTIQHPGHVHFFKHAIREFEGRGHEVFVFGRENEVTAELLDTYDIEHEMLAGHSHSILSLAAVQATYEMRLLRRARRIRPDVITAIGGVAASHVSKLVNARSVVFYDTEHARIITGLAYPFADVICTPDCYADTIGRQQVRYPGYHELAYLHPDRFDPDAQIREDLGIGPDESLAVCRFSSWDSSHDFGQGGFDDLADVIGSLEAAGAHVVVSSEVPVPDDLATSMDEIDPHRMHDLLAAADVVVSEGATTAAEAAVLGTPAIYVNTLRMGYTDELESRFGLLFNFAGPNRHERGLELAVSLLNYASESLWMQRVERLRMQTVDVTDVIVSVVETAADRGTPTARHARTQIES